MPSFNEVILMGHLTKDPEVRGQQGNVVNFSIAVNERYQQGGEWKEESHFFDCTAFGNVGENIAKRFQKGSCMFLVGKLTQDKWVDQQTKKNRSKVKIIVRNVRLIPPQQKDGQGGGQQQGGWGDGSQSGGAQPPPAQGYGQPTGQAPPPPAPPAAGPPDFTDDDIPF